MLHRLRDDAIPDPVLEVCRELERAGHRAWVVGGCIRDLLMGRAVSDWDLATGALPGEVQTIFRRTVPTGIDHGTVTVLWKGEAYEVTTLRGEGEYSDGRRPDTVEFVRDIGEDLARRDFTVNAIAYDPLTEDLVDPWGGLDDLEAGVIRAVGDPRERFGEDGLRVLRAARFCSTLGFALDPATEAAIEPSLETFRMVSPERVHEEWKKALRKSARPSLAFEVMRRTGILSVTCPALAELDQRWIATMERVDRAPRDEELRLAALLLDVEVEGSQQKWADGWLRSMRCSNQERRRVLHLLAHGRVPAPEGLDDPALRRWLRDVGRDDLDAVLALGRADGREVDELEARARRELERGLPLEPRELPVGGKDVMDTLSISPGRVVGDVLEDLLDRVMDDPTLASRERLLSLIPEAYRSVSEGA